MGSDGASGIADPYGADKQAKTPIAMSFDTQSGRWSAVNTALAHGDYYRYQITVYHPATDQIETYQVTDPYSHSLAINSLYSQVVDLNHADLKPAGWDTLAAPHPQNSVPILFCMMLTSVIFLPTTPPSLRRTAVNLPPLASKRVSLYNI